MRSRRLKLVFILIPAPDKFNMRLSQLIARQIELKCTYGCGGD